MSRGGGKGRPRLNVVIRGEHYTRSHKRIDDWVLEDPPMLALALRITTARVRLAALRSHGTDQGKRHSFISLNG